MFFVPLLEAMWIMVMKALSLRYPRALALAARLGDVISGEIQDSGGHVRSVAGVGSMSRNDKLAVFSA